MFRRRWVRWLLGALGLVLVGYTVYYQAVIAPDLTAHRFGVEVAGEESRLVVEVDEDAPLVAMNGGVNGLSQVITTGDSLFLLTSDVGAQSDMTWVEVPWQDINPPPNALAAAHVFEALSINGVRCRPLGGDAAVLVSMMLARGDMTDGSSLCGSRVGAVADRGEDVIVNAEAVRPSDLTAVPTASVVALVDVPNKDHVLAELQRLLHDA